jgi:poly-gamma-glutamate synthesis protein (capsule biosynthesis protein)
MRRRGTARAERHARTAGPGLALLVVIVLLSLPSGGRPDAEDSPSTASEQEEQEQAGSSASDPTSSSNDASGGSSTTAGLPEPREVTLVATGDVLLHEPLWRQAAEDAAASGVDGYDFGPVLAGVEPLVSGADLAICHLETTLAPPEGPFSGYPVFSVPPEIAPALAETGYDACSTASNHVYDKGADGIDRTLDDLDDAGIDHAGSARNEAESEEPTILEADGVAVALLSYTYTFNGIPPPDGETWRSNLIDEAAILDEAAAAREAGADVVVVSMHWGDDHRHEPNAQQEELAPRLIGSEDIDLLLGHHAHVVQPIEQFDDGWVVYGMGNHLANQATLGPEKAEGLLVRFTFTEDPAGGSWEATAAEYAPTLLDRAPWPRRLVVVADALADPRSDAPSPQRLQEAWDRTTHAVLSRDADEDGLTAIRP